MTGSQELLQNRRLLGFGLATAAFSTLGQTYFLGVYRAPIREEFGLSDGGFGLLYLAVTLGSALGINLLGHLIDRYSLRAYTLVEVAVLGGAALLLSATDSLPGLLLLLLVVRLMGQGMMMHTAMTSMSRYFSKARGMAVAVASLGLPLGQAVMPPLAVWLMMSLSWRQSWTVLALGFLVIGPLLVFWLLRGHDRRHTDWAHRQAAADRDTTTLRPRQWTRRDVLRDPRFYLIMPALVAMPFWVTAVFFFAESYASAKGLTMQVFTALYWTHALGAAVVPFLCGALVDRFGGRRLIWLFPPLLALALLVGIEAASVAGVTAFLALVGIAGGMTIPISNAIWPELYGTRHLGSIKALFNSVGVLASAMSPLLIGLALDAGVGFVDLLWLGVLHGLVAVPLVLPVVRGRGIGRAR
ncbi:MFS transporter [Yunchengibacter salinarum]|uniref:MFS transporter n=1 Tax=Yunchengibacter salinarum TaxID=3133399 RepID=UPI0035B66481